MGTVRGSTNRRTRRLNKLGRHFDVFEQSFFEPLESRVLLAANSAQEPLAIPLAAGPVTSVITAITTISGADTNSTGKNPQSKVWQHDNKWWSILDTNAGTAVYRLSGSAWTPVTQISTALYTADVAPVGNGDITYALLYGGNKARIAKLSYTGGTYQLVPMIDAANPLVMVQLSNARTATLEVDSTGRMWMATQSATAIEARWADAPYTTWSAPINLGSISPDKIEITAIVGFGGKIGIMWSDHATQRFGFRYHVDGANPNIWSANEVPAAGSAKLGQGEGMADDHLNLSATADGTIYAAVKTAYDKGNMAYPEMALLVRRPNGTWDPLYGIDAHGTRGIVAVDEQSQFVRYLYAGETGVNDIVYKDIPFAAINASQPNLFYSGPDFSNTQYPRQTLIGGGLSKAISSVKRSFHGELVAVATTASTAGDTGPYTITGAKMVDQPAPINLAPVNSVPFTQTSLEDTAKVFSTATGNAISISDADAGIENVRVQLSVVGGTVTIGTLGLIVAGNGSSLLTATGRITSLNAALNGLVFTPQANLNGAASIEVFTDDLGNSGAGGNRTDTDTITINLTAVNDVPSFTAGASDTVAEDFGLRSVAGWATAISDGPANESSQLVNFIVTNNNNALFSVQPAIAANGALTYTPAANANGTATVTVAIHDNGGTANGGVDTSATQSFTITVTAANDVPSFTAGANQTVLEDSGLRTVAGWATAIAAGPANEAGQFVNFVVTNSNSLLFSQQPAIAADGTLTYTPAVNANGTATVSVAIHDDGGTANGGFDTSITKTFTITVSAVNDVPAFTAGPNQGVLADSGTRTVAGWATAIAAGPANESGQLVNFVVTNSNPLLFSQQPAISPGGTLTFTPAAGAVGTATVSVAIHDNGGTANGGVDTSATQTFTITLTTVNVAPSFIAGGNQTVWEDAGPQTIFGWATAITAGPPRESGQIVNFIVTNSNSALFSVQPAVSANGTLTFTPAANANGTAIVSVAIHDNGGTVGGGVDTSAVQTFTLTIAAVNDVPSFALGGNLTVAEASSHSLAAWATGISAGPPDESGQLVTFIVSNSNSALFAVQPTITPSGTLTFTPAANVSGSAVVTVRIQDNGGTAAGGVDISPARTFEITGYTGPFGASAGLAGINDEGRAIVVGSRGDVFVAGTNSLAEGTIDSTATGSGDIFLARYGPDGTLLWQKTIGSSGDDRTRSIVRDAQDNIYVTGMFQGTVDFDSGPAVSSLTSAGDFDTYVLKLNANGVLQWARSYGSAGSDMGNGIALDTAGNVLVTGQIGGAVDFNPGGAAGLVPFAGSLDAFVLKLTSDGGFQWAKSVGGGSGDRAKAIATDASDRVYVTGSFKTSPDFDPGPGVAKLTSAGDSDVFVLRLNADGSYSMAVRMGGVDADEATTIAVDTQGNIYTTGYYAQTADFDPGPAVSNLTSAGDADVFVSKLSNSGNFLFADSLGGAGDDRGRGLAALSDGSVVVSGHFTGSADFDPGNGSVILASAGLEDIFLARLGADGAFVSAQRFGGSGGDMGRGLALGADDSVYLTGQFSGAVAFDTPSGTINLTSIGKKDIFAVKLSQFTPSALPAARMAAPSSTTANTQEVAFALSLAAPVEAANSSRQSRATDAVFALPEPGLGDAHSGLETDFASRSHDRFAPHLGLLGKETDEFDSEVLPGASF